MQRQTEDGPGSRAPHGQGRGGHLPGAEAPAERLIEEALSQERGQGDRCNIGLVIGKGFDIPGQPALDPVANGFYLGVRQLLLRRHVGVGVAEERSGEPARIRLAGNDDGAVVIALEQRLPRSKHQAALFLLLVMAGETLGLQNLNRLSSGVARSGGRACGG